MGSAQQEGGSQGRGLGLEAQQASQYLSGQGKCWLHCLLFLCTPPQGLLRCRWVPLGVGIPPLPQLPLRGAGAGGLAFTFAPPSLPPTPSVPSLLEGALVGRGSGPGSQQAPGGPRWAGETLAMLRFDPLPSHRPPHPPSGVGSLLLPQPPLRGTGPVPPPLLLPPCSTPHPTRSLGVPPIPSGVCGPPPVPGRCPSCVETQIPCPPSPPC